MEHVEQQQLGSTGIALTRVGLGSWAMGGGDWVSAWGGQDDAQSIATIRHAVESGLNWIDTAGVYGLGHAEEVVREALAPYSGADRPVVFTKGGMEWDEARRRESSRKLGDEATLRRHVEQSLGRLGVEAIDVYFMHWPATEQPVEEYWQVLLDLKREGKLRAIGLSNHSVDQLERAEALGHVDVIQPPFSAVSPGAADELLPWADAHGTGVVVYSPMGSGLLTGRFSRERVASLPEDDWRRRNAEFTTRLDLNLALADAMAAIAARRGTTPAAVAVAWTLGFPGVTAAIVGAREPGQLDDWLPAAGLRLTADEYREIDPSRVPVA